MTIKQFIEKAIEGGWNREEGLEVWLSEGDNRLYCDNGNGIPATFGNQTLHSVLLDPLAWQAVGKVEGWKRPIDTDTGEPMLVDPCDNFAQEVWEDNMHRVIDALAEGKSVEEYLATL